MSSSLPVPPQGPASLFDCATSIAVSSSLGNVLPHCSTWDVNFFFSCGDAVAPSSTTVGTAHSQYCLSWARLPSVSSEVQDCLSWWFSFGLHLFDLPCQLGFRLVSRQRSAERLAHTFGLSFISDLVTFSSSSCKMLFFSRSAYSTFAAGSHLIQSFHDFVSRHVSDSHGFHSQKLVPDFLRRKVTSVIQCSQNYLSTVASSSCQECQSRASVQEGCALRISTGIIVGNQHMSFRVSRHQTNICSGLHVTKDYHSPLAFLRTDPSTIVPWDCVPAVPRLQVPDYERSNDPSRS